MRSPRLWLFRSGISRRIALAMVLSLAAVQLQAYFQLNIMLDPQLRLVGTQWLAQQVEGAVQTAFAAPPEQRGAALAALPATEYIERSWSAERPRPLPEELASPEVWERLTSTLQRDLGNSVRTIEVGSVPVAPIFPLSELKLAVVPQQVQGGPTTTAVTWGGADELIPGNVRVAIQGNDGSWVTVSPRAQVDDGLRPAGKLMLLVAGGLCIALFSVLITCGIMRPLDRLVAAARRIGATREVVAMPTEGLGEFTALAQAIDDMQQRLLKLVEDRTIMLAAISHDLKSSLTRLRLTIELKRDGEMREGAEKELQDMQSMLDSTLAFATGDIQRGPVQPTDVATLLISLVDDAIDAGADAHYIGPDHAEAPAQHVPLLRAFRNLIDNALKYGRSARVELTTLPDALRICIEDQGPGIDPQRVEEAFAPFRRLDPARNSEIPGAGLGLTIARDVLRNHGGTLNLERAASGGLRVVATLPRK